MEKMGSSDQYEQGGVDDYNRQVDAYNSSINTYINSIGSSVKGVPSSFTPPAPQLAKNVFAGSQSSQSTSSPMMSTMTVPQMSSNKPVANLTPVVRMPEPSQPSSPQQAQPSTPQQVQQQGSTQGTGVQQIQTPQQTVNAPQGSALRVDSSKQIQSVPKQQVTLPKTGAVLNFSTPVKTQSAQIAPQSKPSNNIFSQVKSFINNIFRRK